MAAEGLDIEEEDEEDMDVVLKDEEEGDDAEDSDAKKILKSRAAREFASLNADAPVVDKTRIADLNDKNVFDYPGRGVVDLDKEINNRNRLYGTIAKLRFDDEAQVTIERLLPETWEGTNTKGFSERFHVNVFHTADDLLELIKRTYGGYLYQCVFSAPNRAGDMKTVTRCKVHINAPPVVNVQRMGQNQNGSNGNGASNPNMDLVGKVFDTQQKMIDQVRNEKEDPRMFAQITNIVREMRASSEQTNKAMMQAYQDQIATLLKLQEKNDRPDAGLIKFTSEQASSERDRLTAQYNTEKQNLIHMHTQQLDNLRRDKDNEISRISHDKQNMENQQAILKLSLETNFTTQMQSLKSMYENQISNMKSTSDMQLQLNLSRISSLESQVKSLESLRDQLLTEKISEAKNRPDSLTAISGTLAAVKEIAGAIGMTKDQTPDEPEFVSTIKALKEIGVGETLGKIADRFTGRGQQQQQAQAQQQQQMPMTPMGVFNVPVDSQGRPLVNPAMFQQQYQAAQAQQQPQQQQPRPTRDIPKPPPIQVNESVQEDDIHQPPKVQPRHSSSPPLPTFNPEELRPVAQLFERALNEKWPITDFAKEIVKDFPKEILLNVVNSGSEAFLDAVEKVAPESDLTSVEGMSWLKSLFEATRNILNSNAKG